MREAGTHENTVSGKLVTSVTAVDRVAEVDRSLFWKRAVGDCPEVTLEITGVEIKACYDTGSQCTLMTESCYRESLGGQLNLRNMDSCRWLSLSAANGMEIQRLGYLMTDVKVCEETVKDVVVIVIRDPTGAARSNRCILGMNVISRLAKQPSVLGPAQQEICHVRSSNVEVNSPARTVVNLDVAVGDSSWDWEVRRRRNRSRRRRRRRRRAHERMEKQLELDAVPRAHERMEKQLKSSAVPRAHERMEKQLEPRAVPRAHERMEKQLEPSAVPRAHEKMEKQLKPNTVPRAQVKLRRQLTPSAAPRDVQLKPGDSVAQVKLGRQLTPNAAPRGFQLEGGQYGSGLRRCLETMSLNTEEVQNPRESVSTMTEMSNHSRDRTLNPNNLRDKTIVTNNQRQSTFQTKDYQKTREPRPPATEDARDPQERDMNTYTIVKMASWPGDSQRGPMAPRLVHAGPPPVPAPRRSARAVKPTERLITTV